MKMKDGEKVEPQESNRAVRCARIDEIANQHASCWAPRPMKTGDTASPWCYDAGACHTLRSPRLRRPVFSSIAFWDSARRNGPPSPAGSGDWLVGALLIGCRCVGIDRGWLIDCADNLHSLTNFSSCFISSPGALVSFPQPRARKARSSASSTFPL
jgi:hypothetical protein